MVALNYSIKSNKEIANNIYEMIITAPEIADVALPGQFVNVKINGGIEPFLRRPISISHIEGQDIYLVYQIMGEGTRIMTAKKVGDIINILGPLGNGFPIQKERRVALIGGGIGTVPLLEITKSIENCDAYLGFRSEPYYIAEFTKHCKNVHIATEDGSVGDKGYIVDFIKDIKNYDIVYSCGPKIFLKKVVEICKKNSIPCFISLEERMGCGIGACLVCNCKINGKDDWDYKRVCKDGPVFNALEVDFDE